MLFANIVNNEVVFENNEGGIKATFYEVLECVSEGCSELIGMIWVKDGIVRFDKEDIDLILRF